MSDGSTAVRRHRDPSPVTGSGTVPGHGGREPSDML
jgi:hypothetical protein